MLGSTIQSGFCRSKERVQGHSGQRHGWIIASNGIYGADFHALQLIYRVGADAEVLNGMV